jgi:hypothetical protein
MKPLLLFSVFLLAFPVLHAQEEGTVTGIAWNGTTWLISYYMNGSHLIEYDGQKFVELKLPVREEDFNSSAINFLPGNLDYYTHLNPSVAGWFRDHWMLGATERIAKYDGRNFIVMPFYWSVHKFECAISYCIAAGEWPGSTGISELFVYNGTDFISLSDKLKNITSVALYQAAFSWNPEKGYWLIAFYGSGTDEKGKTIESNLLLRYDGERFLKVMTLPPSFRVSAMDYNGEYWLLGGGNKIAIYDGRNLSFIAQLRDNEEIRVVGWGSKYWLVGTNSGVIKFDGHRVEKIREELIVNDIEWNGEYWLIGGRDSYSLSPKLVKYSGESFEDLTEKMLNASSLAQRQTANLTIKNPEVPSAEETRKAICGPSLVLLLPLMTLLIRRYASLSGTR